MEEFKQKIEAFLVKEGRSQAYLARKLGYSPDQFNKWLLGQIRMPYTVVYKICGTLPIDKKQQIELFELAGYPLPKWVTELTNQHLHAIADPPIYFHVNPAVISAHPSTKVRRIWYRRGRATSLRQKPIERFTLDSNYNRSVPNLVY